MRLSRALREKPPQYEQRHEKLEVLLYPPYSPDVAPSDYYVFQSMANGLADQQFRSYEDIEKWLDELVTIFSQLNCIFIKKTAGT